jgi:hypothetical protein
MPHLRSSANIADPDPSSVKRSSTQQRQSISTPAGSRSHRQPTNRERRSSAYRRKGQSTAPGPIACQSSFYAIPQADASRDPRHLKYRSFQGRMDKNFGIAWRRIFRERDEAYSLAESAHVSDAGLQLHVSSDWNAASTHATGSRISTMSSSSA